MSDRNDWSAFSPPAVVKLTEHLPRREVVLSMKCADETSTKELYDRLAAALARGSIVVRIDVRRGSFVDHQQLAEPEAEAEYFAYRTSSGRLATILRPGWMPRWSWRVAKALLSRVLDVNLFAP